MAAGSYGNTVELPDAHSTAETIAGSALALTPTLNAGAGSDARAGAGGGLDALLAEEEGFEPPVESPLQRISNPPPSTARPLLREWAGLAQHRAWGLSSRSNLCLYSAVPPMLGRGLTR